MNTDLLPNRRAATDAPPARYRRRSAGASLVEVLIVLTIILIGVFIVIQIFPIGFTSLRKSEARLRADRLARNVTETLAADDASLPESISFSFYDSAGIRQTVTDIDPDDLTTYQNNVAYKLYYSDVNKFRYITNEPIRVPLATATGGAGFGSGVGSVHFLTFGPIYMDSTVGVPANVPDYTNDSSVALYNSYLKVTSEPLTRTVVDANDGDNGDASDVNKDKTSIKNNRYQGYLRSANNYIIDYGDDGGAYIMFPPSTKPRVYTISYQYELDGSPSEVGTQTPVEITIPASPAPATSTTTGQYVWYRLAPGTFPKLSGPTANGDAIQGGTDVVVRDFERLKGNDPTVTWDAKDPYQYKLASANVSNQANLGVIAFNPAGANFSVSVPGGVKPFTALASYATLDWHILHDDREVPAGSDGVGKVRTTLPNIRLRGDQYTDLNATGANRNPVYPGLYPQQTTPYTNPSSIPTEAVSPDIQVFNLSDASGTARLMVAGDLANKDTTDSGADYWINRSGRGGTYPTGTIYVNTNQVAPGSKVRILYKAQGDWAVSFQKAAKAYKRNTNSVPTRPVTVGVPDATVKTSVAESFAVDDLGTSALTDDRIYFHRSELNKSVTATFETDTAAGGTTRLASRQFVIKNVDGIYAYATVSEIAPEIAVSGVTAWRVVGDVRGASLKTRVIWQDEQNGRNPYRISDLETFVTQQAQ